jgi:DNA-binding IclR family transcriptional regulator
VTELSRQLQINKSTAHGILTTLTDRAFVLRNPDTLEYRLGPALVPMGSVAERTFPALVHAKREAARLATEHDSDCVIVIATGDELLIIARAGSGGPLSMSYFEGQRHPLAPPLGIVLLAWMPDEAIQEWLARLGPELTDAERERYRVALRAARRRGYAVQIRVPMLDEFAVVRGTVNSFTVEGQREIIEAQVALAHDDTYLPLGDELPPDAELSSIAAPVFGPDGTMLVAIALMPGDQYQPPDVPKLARAVLRAAARVTTAIDGRQPAADPTHSR